jgi:uncharacterized protein (TIGR01244 family)
MKTLRVLAAFLLILMILPTALPAQGQQTPLTQPTQEKPRPPLPNFVELTPRISTGGQPAEGGLKQLAEKGYQIVINIRASDEEFDRVAEEKQALQLGLRYYVIPFVAKEPSEQQALAFDALMSALKDSKVFVHCGSGNRVGSLMMIYLSLDEGVPVDKAEQEARKIGLHSADLLDFAMKTINKHKK